MVSPIHQASQLAAMPSERRAPANTSPDSDTVQLMTVTPTASRMKRTTSRPEPRAGSMWRRNRLAPMAACKTAPAATHSAATIAFIPMPAAPWAAGISATHSAPSATAGSKRAPPAAQAASAMPAGRKIGETKAGGSASSRPRRPATT